jgi:trimeric autotransporter adhesin
MRKIRLSFLLMCLSICINNATAQTTTYSSVGTFTFTVPTGCTAVGVDMAGAQGGNAFSTSSPGGKGGRVQATLAVTPGQSLLVYVGGLGTTSTSSSGVRAGGANGAGGGGQGGNGNGYGAGGGGSSDIRVGGTALSNRVVVAAGGGGAGFDCGMSDEWGGAGGGLSGLAGRECGTTGSCYTGLGGTQTAGGSGSTCVTTAAGTLGAGGGGTNTGYLGGGGGGYYGGGCGAYGGGGGGSSFIGGTGVTGATTTPDFRTGNGYVAITPLVPTLIAAPTTLSFGGVTVGTNSPAQSFTFSGSILSGFPGNITVTAPTGYQVSLEGTLWFSSLTFPFTSATLASNFVFVRFNPTALGVACGDVTISGGGATTVNVNVCGTGANACTGTPTAGTAAITPTSGSGGTTFNLSLTGTTAAGSLTYQWRSSPTGVAGTFVDITGANSPGYSFSGLSANTFFQCVVTCPTFGSATSNNVSATLVPPTSCTPSYGTSCGSFAMPTSIASLIGISSSITDPSTSCGASGANYTDRYATMSVTLAQGATYTANIGGNGNSGSTYSVQLWIDFNDDGVFTSPAETIGGGLLTSTATSGANPMTLTIPPTGAPGTHRMRLVGNYSSCCGGVMFPSIPSCMTAGTTYGETRDYRVVIQSPCSTPPAITGTNYVCFPGTTTLANATSGGTWSSSNTAVATVTSGGVVSGISAGAAVITYTITGGCRATRVVGVYGKPTVSSITPSVTTICANNLMTFTAGSTGGSIVSYNWSGPGGYSATTTLNNTTHTPTSSAGSGSYSVTVTSTSGCVSNPATTPAITVNNSPTPFTGTRNVCQAATTALGNSVPGGTWTSGSSSIATVGASTGVVTGVAAGLTNITYTLPVTLCFSTEVVTVNPLPVVTVTPPGPTTICMGETTSFVASSPDPEFALLSQNFDGGLSGWSIQNILGTPTSYWQIVTPPGTDGTAGDGSPMMQAASSTFGGFTHTRLTSPSFSTLGYGSATLTFNQYLISTAPDVNALIEYSINGSSTWTPILEQVNAFSGTGSWSATSPEMSIALPAGAIGQSDVRLRWNYQASSFYWFLDNIAVTALLPASTFAWTGALGLSCTTCTSPDITPTSTGANAYSITVTSSAGCTTTNGVTVSVNPLPGSITGNLNVCVGSTFMLGNSAPGGTWSSSDVSEATIDMTTGAMTGIDAGTTTITYTLPTGCIATAVATVAPAPAAITGSMQVCEGLTTTLGHVIGGGTWSSTTTSVATVNSFGTVSGLVNGTTIVTYTLPSGCTVWTEVTVNATPAAITGTAVVCKNATTALSNATPGGFWSSGLTTVATIDGTGLVTGINDGNSVISYTLPTSCKSTRIVTVNALPAPIMGATAVCQGSSAVVTNATSGGTWSSVFTTAALINSSGLVTGVNAGVTVISYTLTSTGCAVSAPFTVNALPNNITGIMEVCENDMTALVSNPAGGTWTSSAPATLSIDPSTGVATGMNDGMATVTYTLPTGCRKTAAVTVNALPVAITGTSEVCVGQTTTLFNFTPGGGWSSGNPAIADVSPTGVVTGVSAGMAQITYSLPTGCLQTMIITVHPLPSAITGTFQVCRGLTTTLGNADGGGSWSSSNNAVASVSSTGVVTGNAAGNAMISYTLPTGCVTTQNVVVNPLPANITGTATVCEGLTTTLSNTSTGGNWDTDDAGIATVNASGIVTGVSFGSTNIIYTLPTGCVRTRTVVVNPTPAGITGNTQVCTGLSTTLSSVSAGGVWTSGSTVVASVNASGVVTGNTAGATNITYTLPAGCRTTTSFVVNPLPASITGAMNVCVGATTTLSNTSAGGTWESSTPVNGTVDMNTGVVGGMSQGTTLITYTLPTTCIRTATVVVNPLPAPIFGVLNVCAGLTTQLTNTTSGGTWSSSLPAIATITSTGMVIGNTAGSTIISYTLPTTCRSTASLVVNALPQNISGTTTMCVGQSTTLGSLPTGGNWISGNPAVANVDGGGVVYGSSAGTAMITYSLPTGCQKTISVLVNPLPSPIVGNTNICIGSATVLGSASAGGTWFSSDAGVAPISGSGIVTGASEGFSIITYTLPTGCNTTTSLIVNGLPEPITGVLSVCAGSTTALESATGGGTWSSSSSVGMINDAGVVTGIAAGTARITYTIGNSCRRIAVLTVNQLPGLFMGTPSVCPGATTILSNAHPSGTWTSDNTEVATIGASTGVVNGNSEGTANITYTLPTGCMRAKSITVHPPVAPITGTLSVCNGQTSTLSNATEGGIWISSNTGVATAGATTGVVTGVSAGAAMITYAMPTGCTAMVTMVVNALPANITGSTNVCEGSMTTLSNTTTGGSWTSGDDGIAMIDGAGMVTGIATGSTMITYTLPTGCMKMSYIAVNALPEVANVTGGGSYCSGGTGVSVGLDASATGTTYTLHHGTTSVATAGTGDALNFGMKTMAGSYTVSATNSNGCMSSMAGSAVISINPLIVPSVSMTASTGDTVCSGTAVTYTASGSNGGSTPTYVWSVNSVSVATTGTYSFTPANGDVVMATYTSSEACASPASVSAMKTMVVTPRMTPSVSIVVAPDDTVCQGSTAVFYATGTNGGDAPVYSWSVGGSIVAGVSGPIYSYEPTGNQTVVCRLNSSYRCPTENNVASNTINMRVETKFIPIVSIIANPGTVVEKGQMVSFTTTVSNAGATPRYQWLINSTPVGGATQPTFSHDDFEDGDSVTCVVYGTGSCGLATINSVVLKVTEPTGVTNTTSGISELKLMPNPNNGAFVISGTLGTNVSEEVSVEVTNMLGQVVYRGKTTANKGMLNEQVKLSNTLANGMYMLNVSTATAHKVFHFVLKN